MHGEALIMVKHAVGACAQGHRRPCSGKQMLGAMQSEVQAQQQYSRWRCFWGWRRCLSCNGYRNCQRDRDPKHILNARARQPATLHPHSTASHCIEQAAHKPCVAAQVCCCPSAMAHTFHRLCLQSSTLARPQCRAAMDLETLRRHSQITGTFFGDDHHWRRRRGYNHRDKDVLLLLHHWHRNRNINLLSNWHRDCLAAGRC